MTYNNECLLREAIFCSIAGRAVTRWQISKAMELNISQIDELDGLSLSHQYLEGEISLVAGDGKIVGRTALNLVATREGEEILVRGTVKANVQFECDRCLTDTV